MPSVTDRHVRQLLSDISHGRLWEPQNDPDVALLRSALLAGEYELGASHLNNSNVIRVLFPDWRDIDWAGIHMYPWDDSITCICAFEKNTRGTSLGDAYLASLDFSNIVPPAAIGLSEVKVLMKTLPKESKEKVLTSSFALAQSLSDVEYGALLVEHLTDEFIELAWGCDSPELFRSLAVTDQSLPLEDIANALA